MSVDTNLHSHFPDPFLSDIRGPAEIGHFGADFTALHGIHAGLIDSEPPSAS